MVTMDTIVTIDTIITILEKGKKIKKRRPRHTAYHIFS